MRHITNNETFEAMRQDETTITEAHLAGLPEPVQRYLRYVGVIGKERIRTVHLEQKGMYRQRPDQKWLPMEAGQYYTTNPPSFLWHMTSKPFPLVSISVTDQFSDGHGCLRVKLWPFISLGNAHGPEIDQGELQRYLLEMAWYPTAWLSNAIEWQAIDANSVQATIHEHGLAASCVLHINEQGQLTHLTAQRYLQENGAYRLEPWLGQFNEYQEVNGMQIPTKFEITWHLISSDFNWLRGEITRIAYN